MSKLGIATFVLFIITMASFGMAWEIIKFLAVLKFLIG